MQSRPSDEEFVLDELKEENVKLAARKSRPGSAVSSTARENSVRNPNSKQKRRGGLGETQKSDDEVGSGAPLSSQTKPESDKAAVPHLRLCLVCRGYFPQAGLLRLTADSKDGAVLLNQAQRGSARVCGRSAYVCCALPCVEAALKGTRLKQALQGRKLKGAQQKRSVAWPLESQLIHTMRTKCTEWSESCQNTLRKEGR